METKVQYDVNLSTLGPQIQSLLPSS